MMNDQSLTIVVDGQTISLGLDSAEPLVRAVIISLFTWRRANPSDDLPGVGPQAQRMGWWGDSFPVVANDRIGSRLWLLSRAKLTNETVARAKEYADEALKWMVDDGVAARVDVDAVRIGLSTLGMACRIYKSEEKLPVDIRFTNVWEFLHV
jgi:phage gp46-like protein